MYLTKTEEIFIPSLRRLKTYLSIWKSQFLVPRWTSAASIIWMSASFWLRRRGGDEFAMLEIWTESDEPTKTLIREVLWARARERQWRVERSEFISLIYGRLRAETLGALGVFFFLSFSRFVFGKYENVFYRVILLFSHDQFYSCARVF